MRAVAPAVSAVGPWETVLQVPRGGGVLVFDGYCGFCTRAVHAVLRLDRRGRVRALPLQGPRVLALTGITRELALHEAWWVDAGGTRLGGAHRGRIGRRRDPARVAAPDTGATGAAGLGLPVGGRAPPVPARRRPLLRSTPLRPVRAGPGRRAWRARNAAVVIGQAEEGRAVRTAFTSSSPHRADVQVHVVAPPVTGPGTRVTIVLHGTERNAEEYSAQWAEWAVRHDRVVLAPRFDRAGWPGAHGYVLGGVLDPGDAPRPRASRSFTALTEVHHQAHERFGLADERFDIWGHSAGAQFVHRYLLFEPAAPVRTAIAANTGWYTLPDLHLPFPYGLRHPALHVTAADVAAWVRRPLVLMRGTADVHRDEHLRITRAADAQGSHRFARAATMYRAGHAAAPGCRWRLLNVPGAAHDFAAMTPAAQEFLARSSPDHSRRVTGGLDADPSVLQAPHGARSG